MWTILRAESNIESLINGCSVRTVLLEHLQQTEYSIEFQIHLKESRHARLRITLHWIG